MPQARKAIVLVAVSALLSLSFKTLALAEVSGRSALEVWQGAPETVFQAHQIDLDAFRWRARPIVVFANSPEDPAFVRQLNLLDAEAAELSARDALIVVDTDPVALSDLRARLRPRGFMLVLIGKDGQVKLRKPLPWDVREISRSIDKMPMRQQEINR